MPESPPGLSVTSLEMMTLVADQAIQGLLEKQCTGPHGPQFWNFFFSLRQVFQYGRQVFVGDASHQRLDSLGII
jgi:hypothetical protein